MNAFTPIVPLVGADVDPKLVFLHRVHARLMLFEAGELSLNEAFGGLVIRQQGSWPDDDEWVVIAESNISRFVDELTDICGIPSAGKRR